jgi:hypothetical protein
MEQEHLPTEGGEITPRALEITKKGIGTAREYATAMSYLMDDLLAGRVSPGIGNAVCNAGGKLMKAVEMQHKYGKQGPDGHKDVSLNLLPTE